MPIDLTDADRALIASIVDETSTESIYRAGLAAGRARAIDECANVCSAYAYDKWQKYKHGVQPEERVVPELQGNSNGAADCAAAIRALNAPAAP